MVRNYKITTDLLSTLPVPEPWKNNVMEVATGVSSSGGSGVSEAEVAAAVKTTDENQWLVKNNTDEKPNGLTRNNLSWQLFSCLWDDSTWPQRNRSLHEPDPVQHLCVAGAGQYPGSYLPRYVQLQSRPPTEQSWHLPFLPWILDLLVRCLLWLTLVHCSVSDV